VRCYVVCCRVYIAVVVAPRLRVYVVTRYVTFTLFVVTLYVYGWIWLRLILCRLRCCVYPRPLFATFTRFTALPTLDYVVTLRLRLRTFTVVTLLVTLLHHVVRWFTVVRVTTPVAFVTHRCWLFTFVVRLFGCWLVVVLPVYVALYVAVVVTVGCCGCPVGCAFIYVCLRLVTLRLVTRCCYVVTLIVTLICVAVALLLDCYVCPRLTLRYVTFVTRCTFAFVTLLPVYTFGCCWLLNGCYVYVC